MDGRDDGPIDGTEVVGDDVGRKEGRLDDGRSDGAALG